MSEQVPDSQPTIEVKEAPASLPAPSASAEIRIRLFGRTDVGQVREHNEDNFVVADLTRKTRTLLEADRSYAVGPRGALLAVCDGMGGAAAGEVASQLAVDIVFEKMTEGEPPRDRDDFARRLVHAVEVAGLRIFNEAKMDRTRRGMGTTATAAALIDDHLFLAQVGDSRGYVLREGKMVQVTRDQSLVNQLIEAGQLTEEEAETFEHNNIILQALGTADTVQVDLTYVPLRRGDTLMLCSDGLSGMVRMDEMREVVATVDDPLEACKILTEKANQAGGHDNITVIVAKFDGDRLEPLGEGSDLSYRKYALPEEAVEPTERTRRSALGALGSLPPSYDARAAGEGRTTDHGPSRSKVSNTVILSGPSPVAGLGPPEPRGPAAAAPGSRPPPRYEEDPIQIPTTSAPGWLLGLFVLALLGIVVIAGVFLLR